MKKNSKGGTNRRASRKVLLGRADSMAVEWTIPTRWLNAVYGVFLLPVAWIFTQTLFSSFTPASLHRAFWAAEEFRAFALGAAAWTVAFFGIAWAFGEPRPLRVYVFGHELTHAIWVWAWGGRVSQFEVGREGGHILTDTHNFLIALAPYFYPLYSLAIIVLYGVASLFYDLTAFSWVLFGLIGFTWAFHLSFTLWMIPKGQSDLIYHGTFFSLVFIYLANVVILSALLIFAAPEVTFAAFGEALLRHTADFCAPLREVLRLVWRSVLPA